MPAHCEREPHAFFVPTHSRQGRLRGMARLQSGRPRERKFNRSEAARRVPTEGRETSAASGFLPADIRGLETTVATGDLMTK